jgi:pyruvate/2-oxoglutarate dehydrogenase complex dihydrolipoamide acyltransferase (E2) component
VQTEVLIPLIQESSRSSAISCIYVNLGQPVSCGEILFEVETDKVVFEVEAPHDGIIEVLNVDVGSHVESGQVALIINSTLTATEPKKDIEYIEVVKDKIVKDPSDRILLEQIVGEALFDKRGIICGVIGLFIGLFLGSLLTVAVLV